MASLDRRTLITGAFTAASLSAISAPRLALAAPPANANLHFNVLRNNKPFGQYSVAFRTEGDALTVTTDVAMMMRISGLTVFDYNHHCEEVWRNGRFMQMTSRSARDREASLAETVSAVRTNFDIRITTKKGVLSAPPAANPYTHWNQAVLTGPLFNPQDGLILDLAAQPLGRDGVSLANGSRLIASHWAMRGSQTVDEWYDDQGVWAGLKALFPDKSVIEYRRA